jgi:hypothetical protein
MIKFHSNLDGRPSDGPAFVLSSWGSGVARERLPTKDLALPNGEAALVTRTGGNGTILQMQVRSSSPAQRSQ